jgi:hypothetical protein
MTASKGVALGARVLAAFLAVHGGGLLLGATVALLASRPADRALALTRVAQ